MASGVLKVGSTEAAAEHECSSQATTADRVECNERSLLAAEVELTRAYKSTMAQISSRTDLDPDLRRKWAEAVRNAQRAWITFRDRDCGDPIRFEWLNGSGVGAAAAQCRLTAIKSRASQLTARYPDQRSNTPSQALSAPVARQNSVTYEMGRKTAASPEADRCTVKAGDNVTPITPQTLSKRLVGLAATKSEFESSQDFEDRKITAQQNVQPKYIVTATASSDHISYDADRERFAISKFSWANISPDLESVRGLDERPISVLTNYHGLGLSTSETPSGTYRGSNAYGVSAEIVRLRRQTYGVFDRLPRPGENTWRLDFDKGDGAPASPHTGGIFLDASRSDAQALKANIRFAVELAPRPPFVVRGSRRFEPRIDRPTDIDETTEIFVGKVGCLIVIDSSGTVLRTVPAGY